MHNSNCGVLSKPLEGALVCELGLRGKKERE